MMPRGSQRESSSSGADWREISRAREEIQRGKLRIEKLSASATTDEKLSRLSAEDRGAVLSARRENEDSRKKDKYQQVLEHVTYVMAGRRQERGGVANEPPLPEEESEETQDMVRRAEVEARKILDAKARREEFKGKVDRNIKTDARTTITTKDDLENVRARLAEALGKKGNS